MKDTSWLFLIVLLVCVCVFFHFLKGFLALLYAWLMCDLMGGYCG